jgi:aspartyl protease family protein
MATGFMPRIIALCALLACGSAAAADVALIGVIGNKAAVLALDGGDPKTVKVGQTWQGIRVVSVEKERATVIIDGRERVLVQGPHYRSGAASSDRETVTLAADPRGQFVTEALVNGIALRFVVDTGATLVALPASEAERLAIDYRKGDRATAQTANGQVQVYHVVLDDVKLGAIDLARVDAVVFEQGLPFALLGMSFLNRVEMRRDGDRMTLTRRF